MRNTLKTLLVVLVLLIFGALGYLAGGARTLQDLTECRQLNEDFSVEYTKLISEDFLEGP